MPIECEAKIKITDPAPVRARLTALAAEFVGEGLERNWVLDDKAGTLLEQDILLRVRATGTAADADPAVLTVKRKTVSGPFKTREEVETRVDSAAALLAQLGMLGFRVVWRYEKYRGIWRHGGCVVTLDRLPELGDYAEVEGAAERIPAVARELGLDPAAHIDDSYLGIWARHLAARGEARRDMVFSLPGNGKTPSGEENATTLKERHESD